MSEHLTEFVLVYVTCPDEKTATVLARTSVEKRLAACANILPRVHSIYRWEGKIEEANEYLMILKTRREIFGELSAHIAAHHPYETPCIVSFAVEGGNQAYMEWLANEIVSSVD